jgi:hypothetical protein
VTHRTRAQHPPARPVASIVARPDRRARRLGAGAAIAALALGGAAITATPAVAADRVQARSCFLVRS